MEQYFVCILLCIIQRLSVNGQMLVSHKEGVVITSSSQRIAPEKRNFSIYNIVDGNTRTDAKNCDCCGGTDPDVNPWYEVDLLQEYMIQRIHVLGRTDYDHTLYKLEIQLNTSESDGDVLQGVNTSDTFRNELDFTLTSPQPARYITLTLRDRADYFIICELYVYAECMDGTYGLGCQQKCGNCSNNDTCNNIDGSCASCAVGYKENTCLEKCQAGTFGSNCEQRCGMCKDRDVCDIYTGACPKGCAGNYKGSQCLQEINHDTASSSYTSISLPVFIGSLFAVIAVAVTIVTVQCWLFYRKRLNKKTHEAENNEDTSIPLSNTPSNYDTLRFKNPDGESTYTELNRRA